MPKMNIAKISLFFLETQATTTTAGNQDGGPGCSSRDLADCRLQLVLLRRCEVRPDGCDRVSLPDRNHDDLLDSRQSHHEGRDHCPKGWL